jgi:methyl-accepting chemotaxis protein
MMQSLGCLALALLQDDAAVQHDLHLIMIFMAIIAVAVIAGFLGVCIAGLTGLNLIRKFEGMAERVEGKISPTIDKTHALVEELGPKVRTITTNVEQISYTVRSKVDEYSVTADEINRTVKDANKRTQAQVAHVDGIVNEALRSAQNVSRTVQEGVRKPVQQIAGIIAGVKRGIETLVERAPFKRHMEADEEYSPYQAPRASPPPRYATPTPGAASAEPAATPTVTTTAGETKRVTPYG